MEMVLRLALNKNRPSARCFLSGHSWILWVIGIDLHVNPTDTQEYLRMDSALHMIAKPRFLIARCVASAGFARRKNIYRTGPGSLKKHLLKREYCEHQLNYDIHRALAISRENCLQSQPSQDKCAQIPLVVTYRPILPSFQSITKRHFPTLQTSEWLRVHFSIPH